MSGSDDRNEAKASAYHRRASFSPGTTLTELFSGRQAPPPYPGPNVAAVQRARAMSISGTSTNGIAAFRRGSVSSINSSASNLDENAVDEGEGSPTGVPTSPFARRMSFGARALRDVRIPGRMGSQGSPGPSPTATRGPWPDNGKSNSPPNAQPGDNPHHQRRASVSTMPLPVTSIPAVKPNDDPLQERILKGDFYMD